MWYGCVEMYSNGTTPCCAYVRQLPPPERNRCAGVFGTKEEAETAARQLWQDLNDAVIFRLNTEYELQRAGVFNSAGVRVAP